MPTSCVWPTISAAGRFRGSGWAASGVKFLFVFFASGGAPGECVTGAVSIGKRDRIMAEASRFQRRPSPTPLRPSRPTFKNRNFRSRPKRPTDPIPSAFVFRSESGFSLLGLRGLPQNAKTQKSKKAKYRSRKFLTDRHSFSAAF